MDVILGVYKVNYLGSLKRLVYKNKWVLVGMGKF